MNTTTEWELKPMWHGRALSCLLPHQPSGMGGPAGERARATERRFRRWAAEQGARVTTVDGQLLAVKAVQR